VTRSQASGFHERPICTLYTERRLGLRCCCFGLSVWPPRFHKRTSVNCFRECSDLQTCFETRARILAYYDSVILRTGSNLVLNKPTFQSSTDGDNVAGRAIDYRPDTQSCTQAVDKHPWWAVDLGSKYDVSRVNITASANASLGKHHRTCRSLFIVL